VLHFVCAVFLFFNIVNAVRYLQLVQDYSFENGTSTPYWNLEVLYGSAQIGTSSSPPPYQGSYDAFIATELDDSFVRFSQAITFPLGGVANLNCYYVSPNAADDYQVIRLLIDQSPIVNIQNLLF
jgi:hypothetical protein